MRLAPQAAGRITDLIDGSVYVAEDVRSAADRTAGTLLKAAGSGLRMVVIAHGGTPAFFGNLFGVWQTGACAVCVSPALTANELGVIADFVQPQAFLVADGKNRQLPDLDCPVICMANETPPSDGGLPVARSATLDDPALMLFTSGTTGAPKGVVHTFRSLAARVALNRDRIGPDALQRALCVLPTHFGHGLIGNCLTPLFGGADLYLYPDTSLRGIQGVGAALTEHEITFMSSVPAFWRMALRVLPALEKQTLKRVHIGSAPLSAELWRGVMEWSGTDRVANMFGITETANWIAGALASDYEPADGLVGTMWGGAAAVLDEEMRLSNRGRGEILVHSPSLMTGYHGRPDLTAEVFHDGWYRTGDIGEIDEQGTIRLTGRRKVQINKAGIKIHPEEIDLLLEQNPDVAEACAFAVPDPVSGEAVGVAVVLAEGISGESTAALRRLRQWCGERIRPDAAPDKWFFVDAIPKTDRGKINRDSVRVACMEEAT